MENNEFESGKNLEVAEQEETVESTEEVVAEGTTDEVENVENESENDNVEEQKTEKVEKQSKEDNKVARLARLQAKKEAESKMEKIRKEAYEQGLKQGKVNTYLGKQNPYTGKIINDEVDVEEYLSMYELDSKGEDPIKGYQDLVKEKRRAEIKQQLDAEEKSKKDKFFEEDTKDFIEKYGKEKMQEILKDKRFDKFSKGKIGSQSLADIYEDYEEFIGEFKQESIKTAKQIMANNQSSPGGIENQEGQELNWNNMSSEEFEKYVKRAKDGEFK